MHRIVGYEPLVLVVALVMAGCSNPSSPDMADGRDAIEARHDAVLPDSVEAVDSFPGEIVGAATLSEQKPALAELADGADSDAPGNYPARTANDSEEGSPQLDKAVEGDEAPKDSNRESRGDDPKAALIIPKIAEQQDEPLDNGREPTTTPTPEGQRVVASKSVEPVAAELGRDPEPAPGDELQTPAETTPTTKPAAPSRKTLADLSEAIQALDNDKDGQLGVYEWPREKLAEFKTLDTDKDGFLTPAELVAGQKKLSDAEVAEAEKKKEPAESSKEKSTDQPAATTTDDSNPEEAKTPAAETTVKEETKEEVKDETEEATPDNSEDGADSEGDSSTDDQPKQGS